METTQQINNEQPLNSDFSRNYKSGADWQVCTIGKSQADNIRLSLLLENCELLVRAWKVAQEIKGTPADRRAFAVALFESVSDKSYTRLQNALDNKVRDEREGKNLPLGSAIVGVDADAERDTRIADEATDEDNSSVETCVFCGANDKDFPERKFYKADYDERVDFICSECADNGI